MTITHEDLRAAVARGILTDAQSAQLIAMADGRRVAKDSVAAVEEPFVLFKGFNEIFVVVGLIILFSGWVGVAVLLGLDMKAPTGVATIVLSVLTLLGLVAVGRYFTLRRRMIAPSIALSIMTALTAIVLGFAVVGKLSGTYSITLTALVVAAVMYAHYRMFRVPFSAALIAAALFAAFWTGLSAMGVLGNYGMGIFGQSVDVGFSVMTILFGLATFALAMRLDLSDPMRVSTRSATAFWLHVVAAPAIVNTVAMNLLRTGGPVSQGLLLVFLLIIAAVAIVIDRRSFLVSGAGYSVILATTLFSGAAPFAILILGLILVLLGALWERLRAALMHALPDFPGKSHLPPYGTPA